MDNEDVLMIKRFLDGVAWGFAWGIIFAGVFWLFLVLGFTLANVK